MDHALHKSFADSLNLSWNPEKISFIPGNARGRATESVRVIGDDGKVALLYVSILCAATMELIMFLP